MALYCINITVSEQNKIWFTLSPVYSEISDFRATTTEMSLSVNVKGKLPLSLWSCPYVMDQNFGVECFRSVQCCTAAKVDIGSPLLYG